MFFDGSLFIIALVAFIIVFYDIPFEFGFVFIVYPRKLLDEFAVMFVSLFNKLRLELVTPASVVNMLTCEC